MHGQARRLESDHLMRYNACAVFGIALVLGIGIALFGN